MKDGNPTSPGRVDNRSIDFRSKGSFKPKESIEDKMARFLKTSEENLSTLNRNNGAK